MESRDSRLVIRRTILCYDSTNACERECVGPHGIVGGDHDHPIVNARRWAISDGGVSGVHGLREAGRELLARSSLQIH